MLNRKILSGEQVFNAIEKGEFGRDVTLSTNKVVIVMTQDWCPQWKDMQSWIYGIETDEGIDVYELIYNRTEYHQEFMSFKESKLGNHQIPYLRFYKDGKLVKASNYIGKSEFKRILDLEQP